MNPAEFYNIYDEYCLEAFNAPTISFNEIKRRFGRNEGVWKELDRGREILTTEKQLNQYLYSYGPMTKKQWDKVLQLYTPPNNDIHIIDHACGQGLASALFFDQLHQKHLTKVKSVTLIEPSSIAIKRAKKNLSEYLGNRSIISINKKNNSLFHDDLILKNTSTKIHLFSNILDIDTFDIVSLFNKIISNTGTHHFLAVSSDRDCFGGSPRLKEIYDILTNSKYSNTLILEDFEINRFSWSESKRAIYFIVKLKVLKPTVL